MKNKIYLPAHIANYFLWRADEENITDITPMKLIKMVYFSYAWYYAIFNKKLFTEKIEAWKYGPVIPSIYHEFKRFGNSKIEKYAVHFDLEKNKMTYPIVPENDKNVLKTLGAIWKIYKNMSGSDLSEITHAGKPWTLAYEQGENSPMKDEEIKKRAKEAILKYDNIIDE